MYEPNFGNAGTIVLQMKYLVLFSHSIWIGATHRTRKAIIFCSIEVKAIFAESTAEHVRWLGHCCNLIEVDRLRGIVQVGVGDKDSGG
jgi:hypothetical protein